MRCLAKTSRYIVGTTTCERFGEHLSRLTKFNQLTEVHKAGVFRDTRGLSKVVRYNHYCVVGLELDDGFFKFGA